MTVTPAPLRLVIFDLDGTLVDSQATIVACAQAAFAAEGLPSPTAAAIRRIVGLSLADALTVLLGSVEPALVARLGGHYREAFFAHRQQPDFDEPLFPGALEALEALGASGLSMGIATGKAMRGLLAVLERHGIAHHFSTLQTADLHPGKPHPAMVLAALEETGGAPSEAVMIGDTTFDMLMAKAAGVPAIGVGWGNHPGHELLEAGARHLLADFRELPVILSRTGLP